MKLLYILFLLLVSTVLQAQFTFITNPDNTITITGYTGSGSNVIIPNSIYGLPVTSIGNYAFQNGFGLTSITVPDSVTSIGGGAFLDCESLTNVTFGDGVTTIGNSVFSYCLSLKAININPNNPVFSSVAGVLFNKSQTMLLQYPAGLADKYIIPDSVINIESEAFWNCSLTNVTIGNNVISIEMSAFNNCINLYDLTIPNSVTSIGNGSFYGCESLTNIILGNSVTNIGDYAFSWCVGLCSLTIPNSVANIGERTFSECTSLTNVTLGNSVADIGEGAFADCLSLTCITIGNSITNIEDGAFSDSTNLTIVYFEGNAPANVETNAFEASPNATVYYLAGTAGWGSTFFGLPTVQCTTDNSTLSIAKYNGTNSVVVIPSEINDRPVASIGTGAFLNCTNLISIILGNSITNIGDNAFYNSYNLTNVSFEGDAPTNIGQDVFYGDDGVTIYYLAEKIGWSATFDGWLTAPSDLTYTSDKGVFTITGYTGSGGFVNIPTNINDQLVTSIGENAFYNCQKIIGVIIPDSVTNIVGTPFQYCSSLMAITVDPQNPAYSSIAGVLFDKSQTTLIQYPSGKVGGYILPDGVASIGDYAFAYCFNLNAVTIGNTVNKIGINAFDNCIKLISAILPENVTSIADGTFLGCTSLTNLNIDNTVTNIGNFAFYNCSSLPNFTVGNSVVSIGDLAFYNCTSLTRIYFRTNAPSIGSSVFDYDNNATAYYLPGTTDWTGLSSLTGLPTTLWLPQMQVVDTSFGIQTNQFGFNINWASGQTVVVEASTNLFNPDWQPVQTNTLTDGSAYFTDPQWTNYPNRFYRLRSP